MPRGQRSLSSSSSSSTFNLPNGLGVLEQQGRVLVYGPDIQSVNQFISRLSSSIQTSSVSNNVTTAPAQTRRHIRRRSAKQRAAAAVKTRQANMKAKAGKTMAAAAA